MPPSIDNVEYLRKKTKEVEKMATFTEYPVAEPKPEHDPVNHPSHYTSHPSGIECIQITEHMGFLLGNAVKYIWRCDLKKDAIEDLKKAIFYIQREIQKRESEAALPRVVPKTGSILR